jgi:PEP-CTERM motif
LNLTHKTVAAWYAALCLVATSSAMADMSPSNLPDTVRPTAMTGTSTEQASFAQQSQAASAPPLQKPVTQIPEPSTTVLMFLGFGAIAWARTRHTRRES